jgi:hypothetical protein
MHDDATVTRSLLVAVVAAALAACSGDPASVTVGGEAPTSTAPTTVEAPSPTVETTTALVPTTAGPTATTGADDGGCQEAIAGLPDLIVAADETIVRVTDGVSRSVPLDGVTLAYAVGDGVVVAQLDTIDGPTVVRLDRDGVTELAKDAVLFDVASIDGVATVFYGTLAGEHPDDEPGRLLTLALGATATATLGVAYAPEYAVLRTSTAHGLVAVTAISDQTESFSFMHLDGSPVDGVANPTTNAPYAAPPLWVEAVLSPDGTEYAYLEGPDAYGGDDPEELHGDWQLVVLGVDGTERFRATIADQERDVWRIDFDGRFVVASIADLGGDEPDEVAVVDTTDGHGPVTLCGLSGTANFVD